MQGIYGLVPGRLIVHPQPYEDELLTHWFYRLARANNLRVQTLADYIFGVRNSFWSRDQDKLASPRVMERLADVTGKEPSDIRAMTLAAYEGYLSKTYNPFGNSRWILPLGIYHRKRKNFGIQYCPRCLEEDAEPYFRRKWRLALSVICPVHREALHDRCPDCGAPVVFQRNDIGQYKSYRYRSSVQCHVCGVALSTARSAVPMVPDKHTLDFLCGLGGWLDRGWYQGCQGVLNYSHQLLDVLHYLAGRLGSRKGTLLRAEVERRISWDDSYCPPAGRYEIEMRSLEDRQRLFAQAAWLLQEWPGRFVDVCKQSKAWASILLCDFDAPWWYANVVNWELYRTDYQANEQEGAAIARYVVENRISAPMTHVKHTFGDTYCEVVRDLLPRPPPRWRWPGSEAEYGKLIRSMEVKIAYAEKSRRRARLERDRMILLLVSVLKSKPSEVLLLTVADAKELMAQRGMLGLRWALFRYLSEVRPQLPLVPGNGALFPGGNGHGHIGYEGIVCSMARALAQR